MPMFVAALRAGIQVETHAIGDRANRLILDYYEKAFKAVPAAERKVADPRWRVEHAQVIHPSDIPRFMKLGVIPSMQPSHAIGDLYFKSPTLGGKTGLTGSSSITKRAGQSCRSASSEARGECVGVIQL
jgi:predicted amidohydrolase YtcJ